MRLLISYRTGYRYGGEVSFSPHLFRLFPRTEHGVRTLDQSFTTNSNAVISYRRDLFDNPIASVFYPEHAETLTASLQLDLSIEPSNAFNFLLAPHALEFPFEYTEEERDALAAYLSRSPAGPRLKLPFWEEPPAGADTTTTLTELNRAVHENIAYERREEGTARTPEETLRLGSGSCRDFAPLFATVLREHGVASRLVSGFLVELGEGDNYAYNALHAWVEAYLPGAGWIGFDPTNGYLCNHHHIATSVGINPTQITPILGTFYSKPGTRLIPEMEATLEVTPVSEENGQ